MLKLEWVKFYPQSHSAMSFGHLYSHANEQMGLIWYNYDAGPLDKSASEAGEAQQNPVATNNKHVTRIRNAPKRFKDFVMATK